MSLFPYFSLLLTIRPVFSKRTLFYVKCSRLSLFLHVKKTLKLNVVTYAKDDLYRLVCVSWYTHLKSALFFIWSEHISFHFDVS